MFCICNSTENVQMHHIKAPKSEYNKKVPGLTKVMLAVYIPFIIKSNPCLPFTHKLLKALMLKLITQISSYNFLFFFFIYIVKGKVRKQECDKTNFVSNHSIFTLTQVFIVIK